MDFDTISIDGSTEREEGEIISDELLEDISDDSISVSPSPKTGKLNKHKESLRALSLSSVSDVIVVERTHHEKRKTRRKRRISSHPYHRRRSVSDSSDSDRDVSLTKKLLKEAIRIDSTKSHNNSLRTRLKGMVARSPETIETDDKIDDSQDIPMSISDSELPEIDDIPVPLESASEKERAESPAIVEQDNELIQLRLEALKTAVMNKYAHRKKKNGTQDGKPKTSDTNKENSSDNLNTTNISPAINVNCISENSDNVQNSANNSDEDEDILRAVLLASIAKKITNKESSVPIKNSGASNPVKNFKTLDKPGTNLNIPKIPPFIISVNNPDSDSDDDLISIKENSEKERLTNGENPIIQKEVESQVEIFLKQQRAEVEAKQIPCSKVQNVKLTDKVKITKNNDLYKVLPKSKQLEYEKLIQKLKSAEKKPRLRKLSNRTIDKNARGKTSKTMDNKVASVKNNESSLQQTIRQMQLDDRLQIRGKYHVLSPLLRKLSEASQEQKRQQLRINQLLSQLNEARNQWEKSQIVYKEAMKEFLKRKEEIDERNTENKPRQTQITDFNKKTVAKINSPASISVKNPTTNKPKEIFPCKVVLEKCPINLTDPSDIEFKKIEPVDVTTVPKYTSPLDNNISTNNKINPLEIFCPFEINGSCRDKECSYNHYNKNS